MKATLYKTMEINKLYNREVVSVENVKKYLKLDDDSDNSLLEEIIDAAVEYAESYTNLNIHPVEVTLDYDAFFKDCIILPHKCVNKVEAIYITSGREERLLEKKYYTVCGNNIVFKWPVCAEKLKVSYTSGFEGNKKIPSGIKQGILRHIAAIYYHEQSAMKEIHSYYLAYINFNI